MGDIDLRDIAHALSNQCRFSGHSATFYSVAEHSVRVSYDCHPKDALWGLLHDASEAYLVDLARPLKHAAVDFATTYRQAEADLMVAVCLRFGMEPDEPESVKRSDKNLLVTEQRDLMGAVPADWWTGGGQPLPEAIHPWPAFLAKERFLGRFAALTGASPRDFWGGLRERIA